MLFVWIILAFADVGLLFMSPPPSWKGTRVWGYVRAVLAWLLLFFLAKLVWLVA